MPAPYYQPLILPALPRKQCPARIFSLESIRGSNFAALHNHIACKEPAQANGWCKQHAYAAELLELACRAGCPEVEIVRQVNARKQVEFSFVVSRGLASWEDIACVISVRRIEAIKIKLWEVISWLEGRETRTQRSSTA